MPLAVRFVVAWAINILALWVADGIFDSVRIDGWWAYVIGSLVLGIANTIIKPILALLTLPLIIVPLGLFSLVINTGRVALAGCIARVFSTGGFGTCGGVVIIVGLVTGAGPAVVARPVGDRL